MTAPRTHRNEPALIDNVHGALLVLLLLAVIGLLALSSALPAASPF
ncbi:hypothetical protein DFR70_109258 [Nocardia tenerifensis]|uniref:Uncharacterized protein n=1 Tax=Nocardia tenerifensis TaxID=228006 RepID=A0A318KJD1_9NOCA|nr:hypothetical protein [Nocardia tenerifensis]PXX61067.1 hypothetical protein DFR70_109258 [Nocardia tenerifensis]